MILNWRAHTGYELGRTPNHIYLRPHLLLRGAIAHYTVWTATEPPANKRLTLIPDASGCAVLYLNGGEITGALWGATTRVVTVNSDRTGAPVRIFIEFLPGGLFQLTGIGQRELTDMTYSMGDLLPGLFACLQTLLQSAISVEALVEGLDALLLPHFTARSLPAAARSALSTLYRSRGLLSVSALGRLEGYSPRHLSRLLGDCLGMGPKQFARLLRVNAAVSLLRSDLSLTHLAQDAGFYDQAHFIRDFSAICAVTPGSFQESMSDFYNEPFKF